MSILIKGMKMPNDYENERLVIFSDGTVRRYLPNHSYSTELTDYKAVEVPTPHGRLGDLDALHNGLREQQKSYEYTFGIRRPINEAVRDGITMSICHIDNAPTVIEAEVEE